MANQLPLNERRVRFVYEGARIAAIAAHAPTIPEQWAEREGDFRTQFRNVIRKQCNLDSRSFSPEQLHENWVAAYLKMGWKYGPVRDREKREHPDIVPYDELGPLERDKDKVFIALCEIARQWIY